jgi:glycosyltransferase involved in cell wall biosynthesis
MGGGGAERQLAYLAGALRDRGWDVHVALGADGPNLPRLAAGGATIHRLSGANSHDPRLAWQLSRVVGRVRPDLIQVWFVQMEVLGGMAAELRRVPWIISERSSELAYPSTFKNRFRLVLARAADGIISNSTGGDRFWQTRASRRIPRTIVPNALPLEEIDAVRASIPPGLSIAAGEDVVLFVGRFGAEKNIDVLVTALSEVLRRPKTRAVLCGTGPLQAQIRERVASDGLADRVLMPGYVGDIWPLMKRASVLVSLSLFEGHPNSVLEAAACGCPVVASDIPAHREFLDAASARLVDPCDAGAAARTIIEVLDCREAAHGRAQAARARAARWTIAAAADAYDQFYRRLLRTAGTE